MRFGDETECYSAMTEMQGMMLGSRALRLSQATPKKSSAMGGGMGMPMGMPMGGGTGGGVPAAHQSYRYLRACIYRVPCADFRLICMASIPHPCQNRPTPRTLRSLSAISTRQLAKMSSGGTPLRADAARIACCVLTATCSLQFDGNDSHFMPFGELVYVRVPPGKNCGFVQFGIMLHPSLSFTRRRVAAVAVRRTHRLSSLPRFLSLSLSFAITVHRSYAENAMLRVHGKTIGRVLLSGFGVFGCFIDSTSVFFCRACRLATVPLVLGQDWWTPRLLESRTAPGRTIWWWCRVRQAHLQSLCARVLILCATHACAQIWRLRWVHAPGIPRLLWRWRGHGHDAACGRCPLRARGARGGSHTAGRDQHGRRYLLHAEHGPSGEAGTIFFFFFFFIFIFIFIFIFVVSPLTCHVRTSSLASR